VFQHYTELCHSTADKQTKTAMLLRWRLQRQ